jgi:peptide/nickel transport system substrate-binding protein
MENAMAKRLSQETSRYRLNRREIMAGIATMPFSSILFGEAKAVVPKRGGTFRIGIGHGATTDSIDPATFNDSYMQVVGFSARNCLTEVSNEDKLIPELAEEWDVRDAGKTWIFKLRQGVEFHNGKTFDADDAIASLRHHMGPDSKSPMKGLLEQIAEMKKDGAAQVIFSLTEPNADFAHILSDYHLAMMPAKDGTVDWQSGVGTGGYKIKELRPGVTTNLERNSNYWKPDRAFFEALEVISIIDVAARNNALLSGGVDAIDRVDLKTVDLLKQNSGVKLEETQGGLHYAYTMFCDQAPFSDVNVRLALKHAIDREAFLAKLLNGHGYIGNDQPIGKSYRFFDSGLPQRTCDPDKSKFYLAQASLSDLKVQIYLADVAFTGAIDGGLLFSEAAKKAGISLEVVREPDDAYWSNVWNVKPFTASYWNGRATEDAIFTTIYAKGQPWNETHWANERFNQLLVAARGELDDTKRREMYSEMQRLCSDDGGAIIPAFANYVFATRTNVGHGRLAASWDLDGVRCTERWWFT